MQVQDDGDFASERDLGVLDANTFGEFGAPALQWRSATYVVESTLAAYIQTLHH